MVFAYWMTMVTCTAALGCGRVGFDPSDARPAVCAPAQFPASQAFVVGSQPRAVKTGDIDRDGHRDIIVTNEVSASISVLLGRGDGTFMPHRDYATGMNPFSLAIGDIDGDGHDDVAVGDDASSTVSILLANANGTFQPAITVTDVSIVNPQSTGLADFDHDGNLDLVTVSVGDDCVTLSLGNGDGTFRAASCGTTGTSPSQPYGMVIADFDPDGIPDVVATVRSTSEVRVFKGQGNDQLATSGSFPSASIGAKIVAKPWDVVAADFDGDGLEDLAIANNYSTSTIAIYRGLGGLTFGGLLELPASVTSWTLAAGDVTGDGRIDLVCADGDDNGVSIYAGNGDGTFAPRQILAGGTTVESVALDDFNSDRLLDIVATDYSGNVVVWLASCP